MVLQTLDTAKIISASVIPVIVISACGLISLALYNRLAIIVSRLRGFQRERLREHELLVTKKADEKELLHRQLLLRMLSSQTTHVMHRAKLLRMSIHCFLTTMAFLISCSLILGISIIFPAAEYFALAFFICGMLSMLTGVIFAILELRLALHPIALESQFIDDMIDIDENKAVTDLF